MGIRLYRPQDTFQILTPIIVFNTIAFSPNETGEKKHYKSIYIKE
jgi:hypothetical protein